MSAILSFLRTGNGRLRDLLLCSKSKSVFTSLEVFALFESYLISID